MPYFQTYVGTIHHVTFNPFSVNSRVGSKHVTCNKLFTPFACCRSVQCKPACEYQFAKLEVYNFNRFNSIVSKVVGYYNICGCSVKILVGQCDCFVPLSIQCSSRCSYKRIVSQCFESTVSIPATEDKSFEYWHTVCKAYSKTCIDCNGLIFAISAEIECNFNVGLIKQIIFSIEYIQSVLQVTLFTSNIVVSRCKVVSRLEGCTEVNLCVLDEHTVSCTIVSVFNSTAHSVAPVRGRNVVGNNRTVFKRCKQISFSEGIIATVIHDDYTAFPINNCAVHGRTDSNCQFSCQAVHYFNLSSRVERVTSLVTVTVGVKCDCSAGILVCLVRNCIVVLKSYNTVSCIVNRCYIPFSVNCSIRFNYSSACPLCTFGKFLSCVPAKEHVFSVNRTFNIYNVAYRVGNHTVFRCFVIVNDSQHSRIGVFSVNCYRLCSNEWFGNSIFTSDIGKETVKHKCRIECRSVRQLNRNVLVDGHLFHNFRCALRSYYFESNRNFRFSRCVSTVCKCHFPVFGVCTVYNYIHRKVVTFHELVSTCLVAPCEVACSIKRKVSHVSTCIGALVTVKNEQYAAPVGNNTVTQVVVNNVVGVVSIFRSNTFRPSYICVNLVVVKESISGRTVSVVDCHPSCEYTIEVLS